MNSTVSYPGRKKGFQDKLPYILSFLIPLIVMLAVFMGRGIFPFGDRSFLRTDLYHQYAPFHKLLREKLVHGEDLYYSWRIGLGVNFVALAAYYLSSPMTIFLYLFPRGNVIEYISYAVIVKIALSGLTMCTYLRFRFRDRGMVPALLSSFYALSGYMAAYSWNIMWLDCIWLFPLILLGMDRLLQENRIFLYTLTLAFAIFSNYYIAMMICASVILFFFAHLLLLDRGGRSGLTAVIFYLRKFILWSVTSLLAGGMAALLLFPEIAALGMTASGSFYFPRRLEEYFGIFDMVSRHLMNVQVHMGLDHWPNIYAGVAVFFLIPFFYMNPEISMKKKIIYTLILFFYYISFSFNILNFIWHGFHYPNSLPARQSFAYIFLILLMSYEGLARSRNLSRASVIRAFWGALFFILLAQKFETDKAFYSVTSFYPSLIFIALYYLLLHLWRTRKLHRDFLVVFALMLVFLENTINTNVTSVTTISRKDYVVFDKGTDALLSKVQREDKSPFYRIEKIYKRSKDDGAWYGYDSASIFSSTANARLSDLYKKLGMESSTNAYSINGANPLTASLLGVKYYLAISPLEDSPYWSEEGKSGNMWMYRNPNALPLGMLTETDLPFIWQGSHADPALNLNDFVRDSMGGRKVFYSLNVMKLSDTTATISVQRDGIITAYVYGSGVRDIESTINGRTTRFGSTNRGYLLELGYQKAGTEISLRAVKEKDSSTSPVLSVAAYRMDDAAFNAYIEAMKAGAMEITSFQNTKIQAKVKVTEPKYLLTTIPYEKGWSVKVDGKPYKIEPFQKAFIGLILTPGDHVLEFSYMPDGLKTGAIVSLSSLILFLLLLLGMRLYRNSRPLPKRVFAELPLPSDPWDDEDKEEELSPPAIEEASLPEEEDSGSDRMSSGEYQSMLETLLSPGEEGEEQVQETEERT